MYLLDAIELVLAKPELKLIVPIKQGIFIMLRPNPNRSAKSAFSQTLIDKYNIPSHIPRSWLVTAGEITMTSNLVNVIREITPTECSWECNESDFKRTQFMVY